MLPHSPPLPLTIDYLRRYRDMSTEDEEDILLALQHRNRVQRIRLMMPILNLQKLIMAIDGQCPILEYLYIASRSKHDASLVLPRTFQAPELRHLVLDSVASNIGFPLLTTTVGLVTLSLRDLHTSSYFRPNDLLQRLSHMPQLETLMIAFHSPVPNRDISRQLLHNPVLTHATLPHLRSLTFGGVSAYLEVLLPRMTTPLLEKLQVTFFNQLTFSVPHLLQLMSMAENLRFSSATLRFYD